MRTIRTEASVTLCWVALPALAQSGGGYELSLNTIDGGRGTSSGGKFTMSGTIANPFDTVQEGIEASGHGTTLVIEVEDYDESGVTTFNRRGVFMASNGMVVIR